jgi:hypothetical protein
LRSLDNSLRSRYGMTLDDYNDMFKEQKGSCAICKTHQVDLKGKLCVDHCHKSGKVRALLCYKCNNQVGVFEHSDIKALSAYVDYHNQHPQETRVCK